MTIAGYNSALQKRDKAIAMSLQQIITKYLPMSESKLWHGHPVWFIDGNPIVGYSKQKAGIRLMFWSGKDFGEKSLNVVSEKFKDASIFYTDAREINVKDLKRWLKISVDIQWDYKNIVKRKGKLEKVKPLTRQEKNNLRMYAMSFAKLYPMYIAKANKKKRTEKEVLEIIYWLTGYTALTFQKQLKTNSSIKLFFEQAPKLNARRKLITGIICGVKIEEIQDPLMKEIRYLDKLIDELAKGKSMETILR